MMKEITSKMDELPAACLDKRIVVAQMAILVVLVWVFYARTMGYGFTTWDDVIYVTKNTVLDKPTSQNIRRIVVPGNPTGAHDALAREMLYIPVTYLSFLAETTFFGKSPGVMHCTNIFLHMFNVLLVYMLCLRLTQRRAWAAFAAAAAFAVHPLQAEAVCWIMGRKDLLSTMLAFAAILSYLQFLDSKLKRWHKLSILLYALAVFAKPSVIILPAILILLDYRQHGRWLGGEWGNKIPYLVIMILAYFLNQQMPKEQAMDGPDFMFRLLTVPWLVWHWGSRLLLLAEPVPIYAWPDQSRSMLLAIQGIPLFGAVGVLFVVAWKKGWSWLWQGMLAFAIAFLPAASVVLSARRFYTADRYGYMPIAILFMLLAVGLAGTQLWQKAYTLVFSAWLVAAGVFVVPVVTVWSDSCLVWNKVLKHSPNYSLARLNRANTLAEAKRFDEALDDFQMLLTQCPENAQVYWNLAQLYLDRGVAYKAAAVLENGTLKIPANLDLALKLAEVYEMMGETPKAVAQFQVVLGMDPGNAKAAAGIARTLKRFDEARLRKNPNDVKALMNLGLIAAQEGDLAVALKHLTRATKVSSPHQVKALCALVRVLRRQGDQDKARAALKRAAAMRPKDPEVVELQKN